MEALGSDDTFFATVSLLGTKFRSICRLRKTFGDRGSGFSDVPGAFDFLCVSSFEPLLRFLLLPRTFAGELFCWGLFIFRPEKIGELIGVSVLGFMTFGIGCGVDWVAGLFNGLAFSLLAFVGVTGFSFFRI